MDTFAFKDIVVYKFSSCKKCLSIIYSTPCELDKKFVGYMKGFGETLYPLDKTKLIKIKTSDDYEIESKLGITTIKFKIPKKFEGKNLDEVSRKREFEEGLIAWLENTLEIKIKG